MMMTRKACLLALLLAVAAWHVQAQVPDADTLRQAATGQVGGYLNDYFCGDGSTSEFIDTLDDNSGLGGGRKSLPLPPASPHLPPYSHKR